MSRLERYPTIAQAIEAQEPLDAVKFESACGWHAILDRWFVIRLTPVKTDEDRHLKA